jgi:hypothetical protein
VRGKEKGMFGWRRLLWPWSVVHSTVITLGAAVALSRTSKRPETAASAAGSTRTRQTGARCTGAPATAGSSREVSSAPDAARTCAHPMTGIPQAARSADAIFAPAGTDAAAQELLCGFVRVLAQEEHGAHVDSTRDSLGALMEAVLDTIDEIAGVVE